MLSHALYPNVFLDWKDFQAVFGDVGDLPTHLFLKPLNEGEEVELSTSAGKDFIIKLVSKGTPNADGIRQVIMELNGERWFLPVTDASVEESTVRREGYIDWHDYFMSVAMLSAFRSKDPSRQVGACIVDPSNKRIVGIGYNGFPWGCSDETLPWARRADGWLDTKYPYVCHAELNAIMNKNTASLEGCRIYTTLFPCNECAKLIVQSRMSEVVYLSDAQRDTDPNTASRRILNLASVNVVQHRPAVRKVLIDFDDELAL